MAHSPSPPLDAPQQLWLLAAAAITALPLAFHVPPWLTAAVATALALRAWLVVARLPSLSRGVLALAAVAGGIGVFVQFGTLFGQNAGVALLALLLALKLYETATQRDGIGVVLLCYFLALTVFFYTQTIAVAAALLAVVAVTTAALASLSDSRQKPAQLLRLAGLMLAQAAPFLLILFVLFPRVSGPLWGLPRDAFSAVSGLSDSMAPGSIGRLSLSDAIAFRARFAGEPPRRDQLYWRGPVLTQFDGIVWRPVPFALHRRLPYAATGNALAYEITLEPHNKPWLFALELPASLPPDSVFAGDFQLLTAPVTQRRRYEMRSLPDLTLGEALPPAALVSALQLPPGRNPRVLALGRDWRARHSGDGAAIVREAVGFFVGQKLAYTLEPPPLPGADSVDDFLFETRQGFCEHFAGAFVVALRAAGVPARVVTGYQGGEINPVDGYLTVRQSDAHAWAEAWLAGRGWVRIDPTAASFPRRIEQNLAAAVPAGDPVPFLLRTELDWLRQLRFRWDALANTWNQWVLGYNPQRQREFLARLGMRTPDPRSMTLVLAGFSAAILALLAAWALHQRRRLDPAQRLWLQLGKRLARCGLPRAPWEGPDAYAARVAARRPDLAAEMAAIAGLYGRIRYAGDAGLDALRRRIAAFKPR